MKFNKMLFRFEPKSDLWASDFLRRLRRSQWDTTHTFQCPHTVWTVVVIVVVVVVVVVVLAGALGILAGAVESEPRLSVAGALGIGAGALGILAGALRILAGALEF